MNISLEMQWKLAVIGLILIVFVTIVSGIVLTIVIAGILRQYRTSLKSLIGRKKTHGRLG